MATSIKNQSIERRKADPSFKTSRSTGSFRERHKSKTVSLLLSTRLAEAEAEPDLDELQESSQDEESDSTNDLTLNETLIF